jgi:hypothetical protein
LYGALQVTFGSNFSVQYLLASCRANKKLS